METQKGNDMSQTAVVILNWNGLKWLQQFLGNAVAESTGEGITVCVADNGSTDGSAEWVAATFPAVRLIRLEKNHGFAGGYNLALSMIDARYVVLLNSDVEVTRGWLAPIVECLDSDPGIAACQPKIKSFYKKDHFEYAGAAGGYIDKFGFTFCRGRIFGKVEKDLGQYDDAIDIFWASGACMAVRKDVWESCGGLDSSFFAHMEEIDLCWRIHAAGFRIRYIPSSVVFHAGGGAIPYESVFKTYLNFRNNLFLLYKNLPDNKLQKIITARKLLDGVAAARFLLMGRFGSLKAVVDAHIDFRKKTSGILITRGHPSELPRTSPLMPCLNKSVVFEFFIKGRKTFSRLLL
jgi:GT2 family glycosyltransferase